MRSQDYFLLALFSLSLSACGGAHKQGQNAATAAPYQSDQAAIAMADLSTPEGKRSEISRRFREISQWRRQGGQAREPYQDDVASAPESVELASEGMEPRSQSATATAAGRSLTCTDTCKIQAAICDNAESICQLASELNGDEWAYDKCESSKASCKDASEKCTECTPGEPKKDTDTTTSIPPTL